MIKVFAEGRVAQDAKVFEYKSGRDTKTGVSFGLICNRFYNDENPTYIQCTIFNRDEKTAQYITVGRQMVCSGNLNRNNEGYYSLVVDEFAYGQVPASHGSRNHEPIAEYDARSTGGFNDDVPFH